MAHVVFFRAANVGGHQTFQPSALAKELSHLDCISVGAAGTFVVSARVSESALRKELLSHLAFDPEMMICSARELLALVDGPWIKKPTPGAQRYVTVLARSPVNEPGLPLNVPPKGAWQVSVTAVSGRFALSQRRPGGAKLVYPNEVVEKAFGVAATTRNWTTVVKICDVLRG